MRPDLIVEAFSELYPDKSFDFNPILKYSGKFDGFNANIKMRGSTLTVAMSKQWRGVSKDIQIGLIQDLLVRLLREKKSTTNIQLYHAFLRNVHHAVPKTKKDEVLAASFNRVNDRFFNGMLEMPNLEWMDSRNPVGQYAYGTDTIKMTRALAQDEEILDYVMYHEMLHKKHKFSSTPGRHKHHSKAFREDEAKFGDKEILERRLQQLLMRGRRRASSVLSWLGF